MGTLFYLYNPTKEECNKNSVELIINENYIKIDLKNKPFLKQDPPLLLINHLETYVGYYYPNSDEIYLSPMSMDFKGISGKELNCLMKYLSWDDYFINKCEYDGFVCLLLKKEK